MASVNFIQVLLCTFIIASFQDSFVTCAQMKRDASSSQVTLSGTTQAAETEEEVCVVDPGLERRTILLEEAATTWGATLPPMLDRLSEISNSMQTPPVVSTPTGRDCTDLLQKGHTTSGVYRVGLNTQNREHFYVYCDMENEGGGWTVFQRRFDGCTDFYRGWDDYVNGFGILDDEYWLGLKYLHLLTSLGKYEMHVELEAFDGTTAHASYDSFRISDEIDNYKLNLGVYSGTAGDGLHVSRNQPFTTKDRDNDAYSSGNCAVRWTGAGWYNNCLRSNLNGQYLGESQTDATGIVWREWTEKGSEVLKVVEMKIRRED